MSVPEVFSRRHSAAVHPLPLLADIVAKVENRTALKISRKSIFGLLCCRVAFQRPYGGPCSILDEAIWSLTSPRARRISGSKNFRSPPRKDFCNNICHKRTWPHHSITSSARADRPSGTSMPSAAVGFVMRLNGGGSRVATVNQPVLTSRCGASRGCPRSNQVC